MLGKGWPGSGQDNVPTSVALADITRAKVRRLSGKRTTFLVTGGRPT